MKKKTTVHRLLSGVLVLLGFASCSNNDDPGEILCEYGTPNSKFIVKGSVASDKNEPLKGIQVIVRQGWNNSIYSPADTVYTDENGKFETKELGTTSVQEQKVYFNDIDGEENGGAFKSDSALVRDLEPKRLEEGKGWYAGKFEFSTKEPVKLSEEEKDMEI